MVCLLPARLTNNSPGTFTDVQDVDDDHVDVNIVLWKLNSCSNDQSFDTSAFFAIHDMEPDDVPLTREDIMSHFLNGQCASRKAPGCREVSHNVRSPIKMALVVTEEIIARCERNEISADDLHSYCSAIGVTTTQRPEFPFLIRKLKSRRDAL